MQTNRDYSQHGEQLIIENYFKKNPPWHKFFVDVGACEQALSNTTALALAGWRGLLLEPSPAFYETLQKQYKGFPVEILNLAAADKTATLDLHIHSGMGHDSLLSTWYPQDKTGKVIKVEARPLAEILQERNIIFAFDFLSIDTEGMDKTIIEHFFASSKYRPRLIATELTSYKGSYDIFYAQGYKLIAQTGPKDYGNLFFAKE